MLIIPSHLILVQFTAFEFLFSFALKSDDHKTDEDVDHEESDDDDVNNVVDCYPWSVVLKRTFINISRVDRVLQDTAAQRSKRHYHCKKVASAKDFAKCYAYLLSLTGRPPLRSPAHLVLLLWRLIGTLNTRVFEKQIAT